MQAFSISTLRGAGRGRVRMGDALDSYLDFVRPNVKESTFALYRGLAERHLRPAFGGLELRRMSAAQINEGIERRIAAGAASPATVRQMVRILSAAMKLAGRYDIAAGIALPPQARAGGVRTPRVFSDEDWQKLAEYLLRRGDSVCQGTLLCMYTGLRIGELCALQWGDVDLDARMLRVRRTLQRVTGARSGSEAKTHLVFDAPKTANSRRMVPIPEFLCEILRGAAQSADCYVLTGRADAVMEPRALQSRFQTMLRHADVAEINFHALRHTFATRCVDLGIDVKALSMLLGHSDVNVTLNTYVHPSVSKLQSCMEVFAAGVPIGK